MAVTVIGGKQSTEKPKEKKPSVIVVSTKPKTEIMNEPVVDTAPVEETKPIKESKFKNLFKRNKKENNQNEMINAIAQSIATELNSSFVTRDELDTLIENKINKILMDMLVTPNDKNTKGVITVNKKK